MNAFDLLGQPNLTHPAIADALHQAIGAEPDESAGASGLGGPGLVELRLLRTARGGKPSRCAIMYR
jgi:hypothetical protein